MLWKEVDLNACMVIYEAHHIPWFCLTGHLQINFRILRNLNYSKEAHVRAPSGRKTKQKNLIHGEESQGTFYHLNSPLCSVYACVPSWNWRQKFRSEHQLRDNTFSLLSSSGERAWRTSGIFPKDSVSVQDLIPFQRPHSWYFGWGFWQQSTGVASPSPSELISCFLSSAKQHWVHFGLFNHSLTHRHFDCIKFCDLE